MVSGAYIDMCPGQNKNILDLRKGVFSLKRISVLAVAATVLLGSCDTYTGAGAYAGAALGSVLGSAIGGIAGGPRGADYGTMVGMAVGAAVGGSAGAQADEREAEAKADRVAHYHAVAKARSDRRHYGDVSRQDPYHSESESTDDAYLPDEESSSASDDHYGSGFDSTNSGDDRIDFISDEDTDAYRDGQSSVADIRDQGDGDEESPSLEIRRFSFSDANGDGVLQRGERAEVVFEVMNRGRKTAHDVLPTVAVSGADGHIHISPSVQVGEILPGKGIRYTAMVKADKGLGDGHARFNVTVLAGQQVVAEYSELAVPTRR